MKLFLFQTGMYTGETPGIPFPALLVQTPDGKNILIDTGPTKEFGQGNQLISITAEDSIENRLASIGITPANVDYVISTHFDDDHCGSHTLFPRAINIVQQSHYTYAVNGINERFEKTRAYWNNSSINYRIVNGDVELLPGVSLYVTHGHVPGHQAVLIRLPETGTVLFTGDALRDHRMLEPETDPRAFSFFDMNDEEICTGVDKFKKIIRDEKVSIVICGHDGAQWSMLRKAPDYYR